MGLFAVRLRLLLQRLPAGTSCARRMQNQFGQPQPTNVNDQMIRPLLQNASVLVLFLLPMVTMRTYSEEKRSGTIELLLTSPVTDLEITIGKFLGLGRGVRRAPRGHVRLRPRALRPGTPRSGSRSSRGSSACCCSAAASSRSGCSSRARPRTRSSPARPRSSCALMFWIINWFADSAGPTDRTDPQLPVGHAALRRLRQGRHRHEAPRVLRELHRVRPVPDAEVG